MRNKKKILVFVDWYLPGYKAGGPIQSVANIAGHLKNDFDFSIITSDTDLHSTAPYKNIRSDEWNTREDGSRVYYFSKEKMTFGNLKKIILEEQADVLYLNSLFSVFFTLYPLLIRKLFLPNRKIVLAPRGMLGQGALNIKPLKKKLFLITAKLMGLYNGLKWHVSSDLEASEVKNNFGEKAITKTALNLTAPRNLKSVSRRKSPGIIKAAFISRISYKKNLEGTIHLLGQLSAACKVEFDIYGPVEDEQYWSTCESAIKILPPNITVQYKGAIPNDKVIETLQAYHLSILLTFNENFGHSIIESMAAGCPVLISDQTPWKNLAEQKAGWDLSLNNSNEIVSTLMKVCNMEQAEFDQWSIAAFNFSEKVNKNPEAVEQNRILFA